MAASAGSLLIDISTNVARLQADMGKVSRIVGSTFSGIKSIIGGVSFAALGKEALALGDSLSKASEKLGISVEKLSAMTYAAALSDVSLEGLEKGMKKFSQAIVEANSAGSDAATAFSVLGIATKDVHGKTLPLDVLFAKVADRFSTMEDGAGKVSIAVALFGRAGMDMIPILNKGAAGIAQMEAEAGRLGATISGKTAKQLEEANDNLKSFWMTVKGTAASITGELVGALKRMGDAFGESLGNAEGFSFGTNAKKYKAPAAPGKTAAPNIDEIKKNAEERKKLLNEYAKLHSANLAKEGEEVHAALAAEMGMSQEYHDTVTKMGMDEFAEWKKQQEEELDLLAKFDMEKIAMLKDLQDAQRAEMESDAPAAPYLFEDAMRAAEAYGNVSLAIQTMNSDLGAQYALVVEGQSYIALYQQAWMDANLAIAESMTALYSGLQNWISTSIQGLVEGTITIQNVLANLGKMLLQMVTDYIAKWVISRLFMTSMEKTIAATSMAMDKVYMLAFVGNKIAEATASTGAGAARALSEYSWPYSAVVAAAVMAEGAAIIAGMTAGAAAGGAAHGGLDYVPAETTYLLDRGERVVSPKQNEDLTNFLGGNGGNGQTIILQMDEGVLARWVNKAQRTGIVRLVPA